MSMIITFILHPAVRREAAMLHEERESCNINGEVKELIKHSLFNICGIQQTDAEEEESDNEQM